MSKKDLFAPSIVLVCICLVAALLLAFTYQVTAPKIAENEIKAANEARNEVMPEANGEFEQVDIAELEANVDEVFKATNGAGYVITTSTKGFGGAIKVMTAIDNDGNILKVKVTDASNETPGLGSKTASEATFTDQFAGKSEVTDFQAITGASFSSRGVYNGVLAALAQFAAL